MTTPSAWVHAIDVANQDDLLQWELNDFLFQRKYPDLHKRFKDLPCKISESDLYDVLPDNAKRLELTEKKESVAIHFSDGTTSRIYNTEIIAWNGFECEGYNIYYDSRFVYFIIAITPWQCGSVGIWCIAKKDWIFTIRDECLCAEALIYLETYDVFVGFIIWNYPHSPKGGQYIFMIDKDRKYNDSDWTELIDFPWESDTFDILQPFPYSDDSFIASNHGSPIVYISNMGYRSAYTFDLKEVSPHSVDS